MGLDIYFFRTKREDIGYFRKVNFLVNYFESVNEGEILNCVPITINKKNALDLLDRCEKVSNDHLLAESLLPTKSGFFFGPTDYGEEYFRCVENVRDYIKKDLLWQFDHLEDDEEIEFYIDY